MMFTVEREGPGDVHISSTLLTLCVHMCFNVVFGVWDNSTTLEDVYHHYLDEEVAVLGELI